jgi:VWFA-related protein
MKRFAAVLSLFSLAISDSAQQKPKRFEEQLDVAVVEVAVTVVARDGSSVRGLMKENFEIYDDGQKRPIEYFEVVDTAPPQPNAVAPRIANPIARRSFLLVFDLTNSTPSTVGRARDAARQFVANNVREGDLVAVSSFSVERGFRLFTAFTSDRDLLIGAVDSLADAKFFRTADPLLLSGGSSQADISRGPTLGAGAGRGGEAEDIARDIDRLNKVADDSFRRARVEQQLDSFTTVAKLLDRMRGRKQLILLSEGFDASLLQGREQLNSSESVEETIASTAGEVWKVNNDRRFGNSAAAAKLQQMGSIFKRSDVVLHCIDIRGIRSLVDAREGLKENSSEGLYLLANTTGGHVFRNDNNLAASFDRLVKEQEVTYVLAFNAPKTKNAGAFHNLKVKLRDVSGARVFHRAGYYEAGGKLSPMEQTLSAVDIMMSDVPLRDVTMNILAAPFPAEGANAQVPVIIEVPGDSLLESVTTKDLDAELFVYAFDKGDAVEDFLYQRITLDLAKVTESLRKSGIKYYGTLSLPAGNYKLRTLLRVKGSNHDGFQRLELHVPDFALPTVLRPFVFEEPGKWIMVKGNSHAGNAEYPFRVSESFIPAAGAVVDASKEARIALFTYNIGEKMQLSATVADATGATRDAKLSLVGRTPLDDDGGTKLLFDFVPEGLTPGAYVLAFDIRDEGKAQGQSVSVPITVQ